MAGIRQMGEAIDLRRSIPDLRSRIGPQGYDQALRERLQAVNSIGTQQNAWSAEQAYMRQQKAYQQRLAALNGQIANTPRYQGGANGVGPVQYNGKYWSVLGGKQPSFGYGARYQQPHGGTWNHRGLDFAVPVGTGFYAPLGGTIIKMGAEDSGFGNALRVKFDNGTYGIFGHNSGFASGLGVGSRFAGGSLLGYTGDSGDTTGAHLHFETRYNLFDPSTAFDPSSWFGW